MALLIVLIAIIFLLMWQCFWGVVLLLGNELVS